jgi:DNA polymerase-3 subunit beta
MPEKTTNAAIQRSSLQAALQAVRPAICTGSTIPILNTVRIEQIKEGLAIDATDLTLSIRALIAESTTLDRPVVLPAGRFVRWAALLDGDTVNLSATGTRATVTCGETRSTLPTMDVKYYPTLQFSSEGQRFEMAQSALRRALKFARISVSREESRYTLNGILLDCGTDTQLVSSDGHRLTTYTVPGGAGAGPHEILPAPLVKAMLDLMGDGDASVILQPDKSDMLISLPGEMPIFLRCQKLTGVFPNFDAVIPKDDRFGVELEAPALLRSLERCILLSSRQTSAIALTFEGPTLTIDANDQESSSEARESIRFSGASAPKKLRIGVNAVYLIEFCKLLKGKLTLAIPNSPEHPLLLTAEPHPGETVKYIVMPLSLHI